MFDKYKEEIEYAERESAKLTPEESDRAIQNIMPTAIELIKRLNSVDTKEEKMSILEEEMEWAARELREFKDQEENNENEED